MTPSTCSAQKTGGQQEEGHGVVHHVQGEHHQTYSTGSSSSDFDEMTLFKYHWEVW